VAIINGNETAVEILWRRKADHTVVGNFGNTLLHLACKGKSDSIVAHIFQYTTDVNARKKEEETALNIACSVGQSMTILNLCTAVPNVTAQDDDLRNALMIAIMYGHPDCQKTVCYHLTYNYISNEILSSLFNEGPTVAESCY
jgi:ankyrin repeat protein